MKKGERKSYYCPECGIKWQEYCDFAGKNEVFNKWAFENYYNEVAKLCFHCRKDEDEGNTTDSRGLQS